MSRQFNATTSPYNGLIQGIETAVYGPDGLTRISGNSTQLGIWTSRINRALDRAHVLILEADGRWQFDDSNHTDYPIMTIDLVANQRDYSFTTDGNSNLILEIEKVYVADTNNGPYRELTPKDTQTDTDVTGFYDGKNTTGSPLYYDKLATGIFLDPIPEANVTNGLKVYVSREGSYFATTDTTKKPGIAGIFHDYLVIRPAYEYAMENDLASVNVLRARVDEMERDMQAFYARRNQDMPKRLTPYNHNNR